MVALRPASPFCFQLLAIGDALVGQLLLGGGFVSRRPL